MKCNVKLSSHTAHLAYQFVYLSGCVSDMFILGLHLLEFGNRVIALLDCAACPENGRIRLDF